MNASVPNLTSGGTTSCGCYQKEIRGQALVKHGMSRARAIRREYLMFNMAKNRAKKKGLPFNISLSDIVIPTHCPLLGMPISQSNTILSEDSPTLDRLDDSKGYVKGNVWVVSAQANTCKGKLTLAKMKLMVANWEKALQSVQIGENVA